MGPPRYNYQFVPCQDDGGALSETTIPMRQCRWMRAGRTVTVSASNRRPLTEETETETEMEQEQEQEEEMEQDQSQEQQGSRRSRSRRKKTGGGDGFVDAMAAVMRPVFASWTTGPPACPGKQVRETLSLRPNEMIDPVQSTGMASFWSCLSSRFRCRSARD